MEDAISGVFSSTAFCTLVLWGTMLRSPRQRARAFLRLFAGKHSNGFSDYVPRPRPSKPADVPSPFKHWEVREALSKLRLGGSCDISGIPPRLLYLLREELIPLCAIAFSRSIEGLDSLPPQWRKCVFIPLLKEGKPPQELDSFRPVAITSLLCRLCERCLCARLLPLVTPFLHPNQFGFLPGKSVELAVAGLLDDALLGFATKTRQARTVEGDKGSLTDQTWVALVDLTDAFSRVPHEPLKDLLFSLPLPLSLTTWICNWLSSRTGSVFVEGVHTNSVPLLSGVPQGSVLGPLLFLLYINPLAILLGEWCSKMVSGRIGYRASFALYADDITVWVTGALEGNLVKMMRRLLEKVAEWAKGAGMLISKKSHTIVLTASKRKMAESFPPLSLPLGDKVDGIDMTPRASPGKMLGYLLDPMLTWGPHQDVIEKRVGIAARRLTSLRSFLHPHHLASLWSCYVSCLLRGAPLWSDRLSATRWGDLEKVHLAGCRAVTGAVATARGADVIAEAGFRPLQAMAQSRTIKWSFDLSSRKEVAILRGRIHPDLVVRGGLLPWLPGLPPGETDVDSVVVFPHPADPHCTAESPDPVRCAANVLQRQRLFRQLAGPPSDPFPGWEAWSDASVVPGSDAPGGAACTVSVGQGPPEVLHLAVPAGCCSYSAEVFGLLGVLHRLVARVAEGTPPVAVAIFMDSQSTLSHLARGPSTPGPFAPRLWSALQSLVRLVPRVGLAFCFSHCEDAPNDVVNAAANVARLKKLPPLPTWAVDGARPLCQKVHCGVG